MVPSKTEHRILLVLQEHPDAHGLDIARKGKIGRGTIYVLLGRMEAKGFIVSTLEETPTDSYRGIARRRYRLTDAAQEALEKQRIWEFGK